MSLTSELGRPGTGLPTGAIPFVYGDPVVGNYTQADLRQFIPAQPDDEQSVVITSFATDGSASQVLASVTNLPPHRNLRISGTLRLTNNTVDTIRLTLTAPSVNVSNSGVIVGSFTSASGTTVPFYDAATPLIINPDFNLASGNNFLQFEHRFRGIQDSTSAQISVSGTLGPIPAGEVTIVGIIDFWVE